MSPADHVWEDELANVLLSIDPEHPEAILEGEKNWENRRVAPAAETPYRLVLYATTPVQTAVGSCWVIATTTGRPATIVTKTVDETPHEAEELLDYFDGADEGHALRVVGARRFDRGVTKRSLDAAGRPPSQNFRYLTSVDPEKVEVEGVSV